MTTKKEWQQCAERRLAEGLALRILVNEVEAILDRPIEDLAAAKKRIRRALRKIAVAKEIGK